MIVQVMLGIEVIGLDRKLVVDSPVIGWTGSKSKISRSATARFH
jgi:hypothetical protein